MTAVRHPARYSDRVLDVMGELVVAHMYVRAATHHVLDPFAGTGRIHELPDHMPTGAADAHLRTYGVELEPEWAAMHERTTVGDATRLPSRWTSKFDVVATSPCYGNRMADHHEAKDTCKACKGTGRGPAITGVEPVRTRPRCSVCEGSGLSRRRTYRHDLGRELTPGNAGGMQWGEDYRELHERAWRQVHRVLVPGGLFLLNVKDHYRQGQRVLVSSWHRGVVLGLGFELVKTRRVTLRGMRMGANRDRIGFETVYAFRKEVAP